MDTNAINYLRPRKWYMPLVERFREYEYERTCVVEREKPDLSFQNYDYYIIWMKKENLKGLKEMEITIR